VKSIAARGFNVGLDRYSAARPPEEQARRAQIALDLAQAGYAEQTSLGHDGSPYYRFVSEVPENPDCWTAVNTIEVPWLLEHGASQDDVDAMQVTSIRRTFEAAAAMKG
jgi:predicted metal-dependent phosphotriesterase family hydrolase